MPATAERAAFSKEAFRIVKTDDALVLERFGDFARKMTEPVESYFDTIADAQVMLDERQALVGQVRRRFSVLVGEATEVLPTVTYQTETPNVTLTDPERGINRGALIVSMTCDTDTNEIEFALWA